MNMVILTTTPPEGGNSKKMGHGMRMPSPIGGNPWQKIGRGGRINFIPTLPTACTWGKVLLLRAHRRGCSLREGVWGYSHDPPPHPPRGMDLPDLPPHTIHGAWWVGFPGGRGVIQNPTPRKRVEVPGPVQCLCPCLRIRTKGDGNNGSGSGSSLYLTGHSSREGCDPLTHTPLLRLRVVRRWVPASHM